MSLILPGVAQGHQITVETRVGSPIPNLQDRTLPPERVSAALYGAGKEFPPPSEIVNGPSGYYNCMGLVFASRRTQIIDMQQLPVILAEDGYTLVDEQSARVGDIVAYSTAGKYEHVALVVEGPTKDCGVPKVLSKHGYSVEVVHLAHIGPYSSAARSYYRVSNYDTSQ